MALSTENVLTRSGKPVSRIGMGTWGIGGAYTTGGRPAGIPTIPGQNPVLLVKSAIRSGINAFDTSTGYGCAESVLGKGISSHREDVFIATKCGILPDGTRNTRRDHIWQSLELSLNRLKTEYVDLMQITLGNDTNLFEAAQSLETVAGSASVRHVGFSVSSPEQAELIAKERLAECLQIPFSIIDTRFAKTVELASRNGLGVFGKSPLSKGSLCRDPAMPFEDDDSRKGYLSKEAIVLRQGIAKRILEGAGVFTADLCRAAIRFPISHDGLACTFFGIRKPEHIDLIAHIDSTQRYDGATMARLMAQSALYHTFIEEALRS